MSYDVQLMPQAQKDLDGFRAKLLKRFEIIITGLDYTFDPVRGKEVVGNDNFRAPELTSENILHPKQSEEFVQNELYKGYEAIAKYLNGVERLRV